MGHLAKDIPYRGTSIPYALSKSHIDEMLKEVGAVALRWTETPDSMQNKALPLLEFLLTAEWNGVEKQFGVRIQAPLLYDTKRRYGKSGDMINVPNANASMRLLYWYLKARLEAVKFGLEGVFEAFMSRVINQLPDGSTITLGETVREHPEVIKDILPTFEIKSNVRMLPGKEEE